MDKNLSLTLVEVAKTAGIKYADPESLKETLKATVFNQKKKIRNPDGSYSTIETRIEDQEFLALLVVAKEYNLNPFTKEIYAFPSAGGGIVPIISIDGWIKLMNSNPAFDGIAWNHSENMYKGSLGQKNPLNTPCNEWIEAVIKRKDRQQPTIVREYLDETYRDTAIWQTAPKRMLRHKATIQCIRIAFGLGGIYDEDEALKIAEIQNQSIQEIETSSLKTFSELESAVKAFGLQLRSHQNLAIIVGNTFQKDYLLKDLGFYKDQKNQWVTEVIPNLTEENLFEQTELDIPNFQTQKELIDFLKSLGFESEVSKNSKNDSWLKISAGEPRGFEKTLLKMGFVLHKDNYVKNVTQLAADESSTLIDEADSLF